MCLASLFALVAVVPQSPWVVDGAGRPGTNFTDLPAAVAAASHGDTILVRPHANFYAAYSAFTVSGKALTIRGEDSMRTACSGATIGAVPPGSVFTLEGMRVGMVAIDSSNVAITDCSGSVRIANGSHVAMTRCGWYGLPPAQVDSGSTLVATRSGFTAPDGRGYTNPYCIGYSSSVAIHAADANVILHNCGAIGGWDLYYMSAGAFGGCLWSTVSPRPAMSIVRSTVRIAGAGTNFSGGLYADAASQVIAHGNVGSVGSGPPIVRVPEVLPDLSVGGTTLANGEILATSPVTVTLNGTIPGAPVLMAFDAVPPVALNLAPLVLGEIMLPVADYFLATTLDGAGQFTVTIPGNLVPWIGVPVFGQAAVMDVTTGRFLMSNLDLRLFTR